MGSRPCGYRLTLDAAEFSVLLFGSRGASIKGDGLLIDQLGKRFHLGAIE
jgi:hypothetical protein